MLWRVVGGSSTSSFSALATSKGIYGGGGNVGGVADIDRKSRRTAVIVGGGPGGLAAALVLSKVKNPGQSVHKERTTDSFFERIIVLDERPKEPYDPTRAYGFNVNQRGRRFTDAFNIDLSKDGVGHSSFDRQTVPSNPNDAFDPVPPSSQLTNEERRKTGVTSYSIQRHALIKLIEDKIREQNKAIKKSKNAVIEVRRGARCDHIKPTDDGSVKIVLTGNKNFIVADFCVGADGISSKVRQSLEDGRFDPEKWSNAKNPSKKFRLRQYTSPSTGMRIQGLRIDPNFAIPKGGTGPDRKTKIPLEDRYVLYRLESVTTGPHDALPLSILSQKDPHSISARIVSVCKEPNHDIWNSEKIRTDDCGRSLKAYFEKAHPRYDWNKIVKEEEWERFVSTKALSFPPCQFVPSMYISSNPSQSDDNVEAGVVLLGDALHAFPPDLGMGVNMAFCDAMLLGKSFEEVATKASGNTAPQSTAIKNSFVSRALKAYQEKNGPESRAIIALSRVGAPFQYGQRSMKFRKFLWIANLVLRKLLNKLTFGLSPPPAILIMLANPDMSFHEIMKKANTLTLILWSSLLLVVLSLIRARIHPNWI